MNLGALGTLKSGLKLSDYSIKNALFDQQLKGHIDAFITASMQGQDINVTLSSLIDFITQEGNMYLLAEKLEVSLNDASLEENF